MPAAPKKARGNAIQVVADKTLEQMADEPRGELEKLQECRSKPRTEDSPKVDIEIHLKLTIGV